MTALGARIVDRYSPATAKFYTTALGALFRVVTRGNFLIVLDGVDTAAVWAYHNGFGLVLFLFFLRK